MARAKVDLMTRCPRCNGVDIWNRRKEKGLPRLGARPKKWTWELYCRTCEQVTWTYNPQEPPRTLPRPSVSHPDTDEHRSGCPECQYAYDCRIPDGPGVAPEPEPQGEAVPLTGDAALLFHLKLAAIALHHQWDAELAIERLLGYTVEGLGKFVLDNFVMSPEVDAGDVENLKRYAQEHREPGQRLNI